MNTIFLNEKFIIKVDTPVIDSIREIYNAIQKMEQGTKVLIIDLSYTKYVYTIFIDFIYKLHKNLKKRNIRLKLINCEYRLKQIFKSLLPGDIDLIMEEKAL